MSDEIPESQRHRSSFSWMFDPKVAVEPEANSNTCFITITSNICSCSVNYPTYHLKLGSMSVQLKLLSPVFTNLICLGLFTFGFKSLSG